MPAMSGSMSGAVKVQTSIAVADRANHQLVLGEVSALQQCSDPAWDGARITYVAVSDVVAGAGTQRGYFVNEHADGDRDWGAFEGTISTRGTDLVVEGAWRFTGGSGRYQGLTGNGVFNSRTTAVGEVSASWQGVYEVAGARAQAG